MMVKPEINHMLERADSRFALVIATAKRARQLTDGDTQLVDEQYAKPVTTAAHEIGEDKIIVVSGEEMKKREAEMKAFDELSGESMDEEGEEILDSVIEQVLAEAEAEAEGSSIDVDSLAAEVTESVSEEE